MGEPGVLGEPGVFGEAAVFGEAGVLAVAAVLGDGAVCALTGLAADTVFLPLGSVSCAFLSSQMALGSALPVARASITTPRCDRSSPEVVVDPDTAATGVSTNAAVPPAMNHFVRVRMPVSQLGADEIAGRPG